jgi:hypothetical protein
VISRRSLLTAAIAAASFASQGAADESVDARWSEIRAREWYETLPWLVGCNYVTSTAVNQIEMWRATTFDAALIDRELGWAQSLGMNVVRIFLHDLVWLEDPGGLLDRIDAFLKIASGYGIRSILVLFDSAWNPNPRLGPQPSAIAGIHNSQWVQGPGVSALLAPQERPRLKAYTEGVIQAFNRDARVLTWDLWNEPQELEGLSAAAPVQSLLRQVVNWARDKTPTQPLTSGLFSGDWVRAPGLTPIESLQTEFSDVISFHNYGDKYNFATVVEWLNSFRRPLLCTEYLYRQTGSTFTGILPIAQQSKVAALNWGLVEGATQTCYPWSTRHQPATRGCPTIWEQDILQPNGEPYDPAEVAFIRELAVSKR